MEEDTCCKRGLQKYEMSVYVMENISKCIRYGNFITILRKLFETEMFRMKF